MSATQTRPAPFRGPRPFEAGETLYGRDRDARALLSMLIAERIVLLHSPSGAGKTSLIQAALIPRLEEREFVVLPAVRVGQEPPPGWAGNRYARAALLALEEGRPEEEQLPLAELEALSLEAYLARRLAAGTAEQDTVLVVDQFEEVLTRDPTDVAAKLAFFRDLGEALRLPRLWALFVIREEYVAALEPYARLMPTRLATHFRLDLLGVEGALQALREPPRTLGVTFPHDLAARLVDDLRQVNVQQADGTIAGQLGPNVEPVQLQVVGLRLWELLAPGATSVTEADLSTLGDVGSALGDYYAAQVAGVARATGVSERALRSWFDRELITPQGVRGQVLQGKAASAGLPNDAIRRLIDAYLVRAEPRRGATWFELAHDRMIAPVRAGNAAWFAANLSTLQRQADLWAQQGRPPGLLLRGEALREAEQWAAANPEALSEDERELLARSREGERQARRVRNLAIGASVLAVAATLAFVAALWLYQTAERNARFARARELAAASVSSLPLDPQRSLILAQNAVDATRDASDPVVPEAEQVLQQAVQEARAERDLLGHRGDVREVAFSPDGSLIAAAATDGSVHLWDADGAALAVLEGHADEVYSLAFSPDGATLASGGADGAIVLWDVAGRAERRRITLEATALNDLAFSPDGALLAAGDSDGRLTLWGSVDGAPRLSLAIGPDDAVDAVAFSPDGARIAAGSQDALVRVWDLAAAIGARGDPPPELTLEGARDEITGLAFSPDGEQIAASSLELRVHLWDTASGALVNTLQGHAGSIYGLAYSPDGGLLATASADGTAKLWRLDTGQPLLTLAGHTGIVHGVAFSPDGQRLATASADSTARLWRLALMPADGAYGLAASPDGRLLATIGAAWLQLWDVASGQSVARLEAPASGFASVAFSPDSNTVAVGGQSGDIALYAVADLLAGGAAPLQELEGHGAPVGRIAFSPDGSRLASASDDATVRIWKPGGDAEPLALEGFTQAVYGLAYSPDGSRLAAADQAGTLLVWETGDGAEVARFEAEAPLNFLAYSPDGDTLAAAADDGRIYRYGAGGAPLEPLQHGAQVNALLYGPGGELISAGNDGGIRRWAADGTPGAVVPAPAAVYALAPLPEGRLASVGADGVIHIYPLELDDLLAAAQARLIRGPTAGECVSYRLTEGCP